MTAISNHTSPLQMLQSQLSASISSGTVKSADQDALTTALTDIDSSLTASRGDDPKGKPGDVKQKVDDLISQEVSNGKLTSDQADELKSVFEQAFSKGGPGEAAGAGGPRGPGGPHGVGGPGGAGGPPPPQDDTTSDGSDESSSTTATSASDLLQQFLKSLQQQATTSSSSYSATGTASTSSSLSALLVNYQT